MTIFVTGGAGFIGSAVVRHLLAKTDERIINIDKLTYAGNLESLSSIEKQPRYHFECVDICDRSALRKLFTSYKPTAVMHLAAESHVDRSIDGPDDFIQTNLIGTYSLLEEARIYHTILTTGKKPQFRFHHVSTDEVFGSLGKKGLFSETTPYAPNSPYSATKAGSDHLVRAWHHTFGLPVLITNCSNNYGPFQFPEKLIPLMILNALENKPLPVYGKGENIRDWLYVEDHAEALHTVLIKGRVGEVYNIGGSHEMKNIDVVHAICDILDKLKPHTAGSFSRLISFVQDRPGHDQRYAMDTRKIEKELGWKPKETFKSGLNKTIHWYLNNAKGWCKRVQDGSYSRERLGLLKAT